MVRNNCKGDSTHWMEFHFVQHYPIALSGHSYRVVCTCTCISVVFLQATATEMFSVLVFIAVATCTIVTDATTVSPSARSDLLCQPWYSYDVTNEECVCTEWRVHKTSYKKVKCGKDSAIIAPGYCTTFEEGNGTFLGICLYFQSTGLNFTSDGYTLPQNITELNHYVCGQMDRTNRLCSDCIDGFGPSFTSLYFECSQCTSGGVPLYLLVELGPITLLFLVMLIFHVSMTSAPITGYIMYSQYVVYLLAYDRSPPIRFIVHNQDKNIQIGVKVILALYGIWNLDPIRYIVPPFCISSKLKATNIVFLGYLSAFYPLCLIFLTWICIELHDRNFKPVVLLWRPLHRFIVKLRQGCDLKDDLIGVFASFFFLSYNKLISQSIMLLTCQVMTTSEGTTQEVTWLDPKTDCRSRQHLVLVVPALLVFLFCTILPSILFLLYSTRCFRACLSKCHLNGHHLAILDIFMEKYHSCCRDGLNGGRDMRIFSGFYFILRVLGSLYHGLHLWNLSISFWTYQTIVFTSAALMIAIVKPYKKTYINIIDTLQLALTALLCLLLSQDYIFISPIQLFVVCILPALGFASYNIFTRTKGLRRNICVCAHHILASFKQRCCRKVENLDVQDQSTTELLNNHTRTTVAIPNYDTIN